MLRAGYPVGFEGLVDLGGQFDLNPLTARLKAMGGAVVQGDPVGKDAVGIESLDQKRGILDRRQTLSPLISPTSVSRPAQAGI